MNDATLLAGADAPAAATITLELVYLARLREALGSAGETLAWAAPSRPTVAALLDHLRQRSEAHGRELAHGRAFRVAVNHAMAGPDTRLASGDEVAFLPPVTGG